MGNIGYFCVASKDKRYSSCQEPDWYDTSIVIIHRYQNYLSKL